MEGPRVTQVSHNGPAVRRQQGQRPGARRRSPGGHDIAGRMGAVGSIGATRRRQKDPVVSHLT